MNVQLWKDETKKLFWGFIALFAFTFIVLIISFASPVLAVESVGPIVGVYTAYGVLMPLIALCIYVFMFMSANKLAANTEGMAAKGFKLVAVGFCLYAVGRLVYLIPAAGWIIAALLGLVAAILLMIGFNDIKGEAKLPEIVRSGANMLFISYILSLVGIVFSFIPAVGGIICSIIGLVALILQIIGLVRLQKIEE